MFYFDLDPWGDETIIWLYNIFQLGYNHQPVRNFRCLYNGMKIQSTVFVLGIVLKTHYKDPVINQQYNGMSTGFWRLHRCFLRDTARKSRQYKQCVVMVFCSCGGKARFVLDSFIQSLQMDFWWLRDGFLRFYIVLPFFLGIPFQSYLPWSLI